VLGRLAEKNSEIVRIIKVDATKNQKWSTSENVSEIPAFRLYNGGMLVDQFSGAYPENMLQGKIDKYSTLKFSERKVTPGEEGKDAPPREPTVRPMPKNWLPPGVTSE
jgi:thioredoxin-like negative regulator of GroEL